MKYKFIILIKNQVELDKDIPAYAMYEEFKKYGEVIGIYVFSN